MIAIIDFLWYLSDDSVRRLLIFRISVWCYIYKIIDDSIDDKEEIIKVIEVILLLWINLVIVNLLY